MNYQDFICSCIGIPADICILLDRIEKQFRTDEYYNVSENLIKTIIKETIDDKGYKAGNMLISDLYFEITRYYTEMYDNYPNLQKQFKPSIDGYYSDLKFNGKIVENKKQLEDRIEKWIANSNKAKYFYAYAGYYEWFISTKPLPEPYTLQKRFRKIENAIKYAESFNDTVHYCENVREYLPEWQREILDENNKFIKL